MMFPVGMHPPLPITISPPPDPNGTATGWDTVCDNVVYSKLPIERQHESEVTPYILVYGHQTYPMWINEHEEGDRFVPSIDMSMPFTRLTVRLPKGTLGGFEGAVKIKHVSDVHESVPFSISSYSRVNDVVSLRLFGYGSLSLLGPLRITLDEYVEATGHKPSDEDTVAAQQDS